MTVPPDVNSDGIFIPTDGRWVLPADHGGTQAATGDAGHGVYFGTNVIISMEYADLYAPARAVYEAAFDPDEFIFIAIRVIRQPPSEKSIHEIYINGVYAANLPGTYRQGIVADATRRTYASSFVGGAPSNGFGFGGVLDELVINPGVLTVEEILSIYEAQQALISPWEDCVAPGGSWAEC
jgi:hypothetical protein